MVGSLSVTGVQLNEQARELSAVSFVCELARHIAPDETQDLPGRQGGVRQQCEGEVIIDERRTYSHRRPVGEHVGSELNRQTGSEILSERGVQELESLEPSAIAH